MDRDYRYFNYRREGRIGRLSLDRPERLNAMNRPAVDELEILARRIAGDDEIRLVTIEGTGRAFSTGIDLKDLAAGKIDIGYHPPWERALRSFETMDKIVLCLIHGYAIGGGLQLALACDIRVSTPTAKMGLPAINEGLIPGLGTLRLARYIGLGRAKRLILSGADITGTEARAIGLVDHLVGEETKDAEFAALIDSYMKANSEGCRLSKQALVECFDLGFDRFFERYLGLQETAMASEDFREAMAAYRDGRPPVWT